MADNPTADDLQNRAETASDTQSPTAGPGPLYSARPSWSNYTLTWLTGWFLFIPFVYAFWHRRCRRYTVTSDGRLVIHSASALGISTSTEQYEGYDIERVSTSRGALDRLFGSGHVSLTLRHEHYDGEKTSVDLPAVPNHTELADALRSA